MVTVEEIVQTAVEFGRGCTVDDAAASVLALAPDRRLGAAYRELVFRIAIDTGEPFADEHPDAIGLDVLTEAMRLDAVNGSAST